MRQRLPEPAPEPLYVQDIQRVVIPGEEFDARHLVPGCESLEPPGEDQAGDENDAPSPGMQDDSHALEGVEDGGGGDGNVVPPGKAAKGSRSKGAA